MQTTGGAEYTPHAYATRLRDTEVVPPEEDFKRSYAWSASSHIPSTLRSFHLEYLNRTLLSNTKLNKMKVADPPPTVCHLCEVPANSYHMCNECIFPLVCKDSLKLFLTTKNFPQQLLNDTFLNYGWDVPRVQLQQSHMTQLAILILMGRKTSFDMFKHENWSSCTAQFITAKMLTAAKLAVIACRASGADEVLAQDFLNWTLDRVNHTLTEVERRLGVLRI